MAGKVTPLLCELHAHTTWSDGTLTPRALVELYGLHGFDVLCITDHALRPGAPPDARQVTEANFPAYLEELDWEAERAWARHGLLVIPGLELTDDHSDSVLAAHAVAIGLRDYLSLADGLEAALDGARGQGAALIAAHPYSIAEAPSAARRTARWCADRSLAARVDRFELVNRHEWFDWVDLARLPGVATGDFHEPSHLATWKTLLPCRKHEVAVIEYLRSRRPAYLADLSAGSTIAA
jgi:predicted metal-dependent phosphoesterase TrpH